MIFLLQFTAPLFHSVQIRNLFAVNPNTWYKKLKLSVSCSSCRVCSQLRNLHWDLWKAVGQSAFLKLAMNLEGSEFLVYFHFIESVSSAQHYCHKELGYAKMYSHASNLILLLVHFTETQCVYILTLISLNWEWFKYFKCFIVNNK